MSITMERDPERHREVRKLLSYAFSTKALRTQTDIVMKYVEMFVGQMKKRGDTEEGIDAEAVCNPSPAF